MCTKTTSTKTAEQMTELHIPQPYCALRAKFMTENQKRTPILLTNNTDTRPYAELSFWFVVPVLFSHLDYLTRGFILKHWTATKPIQDNPNLSARLRKGSYLQVVVLLQGIVRIWRGTVRAKYQSRDQIVPCMDIDLAFSEPESAKRGGQSDWNSFFQI